MYSYQVLNDGAFLDLESDVSPGGHLTITIVNGPRQFDAQRIILAKLDADDVSTLIYNLIALLHPVTLPRTTTHNQWDH